MYTWRVSLIKIETRCIKYRKFTIELLLINRRQLIQNIRATEIGISDHKPYYDIFRTLSYFDQNPKFFITEIKGTLRRSFS